MLTCLTFHFSFQFTSTDRAKKGDFWNDPNYFWNEKFEERQIIISYAGCLLVNVT